MKKKSTEIFIDGKSVFAREGENILQCALRHGFEIPHFCYHEDLPVEANCRTCLVEVESPTRGNYITTSCTLKPSTGLKILIKSPKLDALRKENLELLLANHKEHCPHCKRGLPCHASEEMKKYKISGTKYKRKEVNAKVHKMGDAAEFDPNACIACDKCVTTCQKIGINFLELCGKGAETRIGYNKNPGVDCIYCGQCTMHCPVGAVREQSHFEAVEKVLKDPKKIVIAQTAPSVRATIGELFGYPVGVDLTRILATAYRKLGFKYVFDVNMGADITTVVEAEELIERVAENKHLPMFTSCCPGWVKFIEFYHPELIPNLTTARSPQIHSGGAYKTWWAKKMKVNPKDIVVVSLMPCTSKKYEAKNKDLYIDGMAPVDYVLTTRELAAMFKKHKIDLKKLEPSSVDLPGTYSGAAAIYGASGGVIESALRTAYFLATGKELHPIEFHPVRGMKGLKKASVKIGKRELKLAVVATPKNMIVLLDELKKNPHAYDYVEVMSCPGGCIGGGGQPLHTTEKIVAERVESLYKIDKKLSLRQAHNNPIVKEFFEYAKKLPKYKREAILYRGYRQRKKFE